MLEIQEGLIESVNISVNKGTVKKPVDYIQIKSYGIKDDAHSGLKLRQISILPKELIEDFSKKANINIPDGGFAENIKCSGIDLSKAALLDIFRIGDVILEVTQIGKKCHGDNCEIFKTAGKCIMPRYGIFCRVLKTGKIKKCDKIFHIKKILKTAVITLSDRASTGEYVDKSGPEIKKLLLDFINNCKWKPQIETIIIPDNRKLLKKKLKFYYCFHEHHK